MKSKKLGVIIGIVAVLAIVIGIFIVRYKMKEREVIVSEEVVKEKAEGKATSSKELVTEELKEEGRNFQLKLVADVKADPKRVYDTLTDFDNFKNLVPDCTHVEVVESQGNRKVIYMKRFILFMGKEMGGNLEYTLHPEELKFEMKVMRDPNANLTEQWSIEPVGGKARVTYFADVKPKLKVPIFLAQAWIKNNFVDLMRAVKKQLEPAPPSS
jgi:ribosome-associated toxin RatA of RatAB toxin-antitoxin module